MCVCGRALGCICVKLALGTDYDLEAGSDTDRYRERAGLRLAELGVTEEAHRLSLAVRVLDMALQRDPSSRSSAAQLEQALAAAISPNRFLELVRGLGLRELREAPELRDDLPRLERVDKLNKVATPVFAPYASYCRYTMWCALYHTIQ